MQAADVADRDGDVDGIVEEARRSRAEEVRLRVSVANEVLTMGPGAGLEGHQRASDSREPVANVRKDTV